MSIYTNIYERQRECVCVYTQPLNIHNNHRQKTDLLSHFAVVELTDKVM